MDSERNTGGIRNKRGVSYNGDRRKENNECKAMGRSCYVKGKKARGKATLSWSWNSERSRRVGLSDCMENNLHA